MTIFFMTTGFSFGSELRSGRAWRVRCHIPHHTTNNNVEEKGGGGLTMIIEVAPAS